MTNSGRRLVLALAALTGIVPFTFGQKTLRVSEDLYLKWMVFDDPAYRPFSAEDDAGTHAVYISLDPDKYRGQYLRIAGQRQPAVFINGKFIKKCRAEKTDLSIDSLRLMAQSSLVLVGLYQENINPENLHTLIVTTTAGTRSSVQTLGRPPTYFNDFVITGLLMLLVLLIVIMRMNFKLTSDYFSVIKIFTGQESEESQLYTRTGSGILFYAFCSLILAFCMIIIFHFVPEQFGMAWVFRVTSFSGAFVQWIKLSAMLFVAFMLKTSLVYIMGRLFGLPEIFGLHTLNWIRLMLAACGAITAIVVIYHISRGLNENVYSGLFWSVAWILVLWIIILFPKVVRRSGLSLFHIFSYLCATEIIPLLVSIKLLYN